MTTLDCYLSAVSPWSWQPLDLTNENLFFFCCSFDCVLHTAVATDGHTHTHRYDPSAPALHLFFFFLKRVLAGFFWSFSVYWTLLAIGRPVVVYWYAEIVALSQADYPCYAFLCHLQSIGPVPISEFWCVEVFLIILNNWSVFFSVFKTKNCQKLR